MTGAAPAGRFAIRDWVVDPAIDEVVLHGSATKIEPRMMRLLVCLARSAGEVVSSQRLLDEVWTDVVVSPSSIYQSISQLRKILGDTDTPPTYIATVPRKGYRLIAPVRWLERHEAVPEVTSTATPPATSSPSPTLPPTTTPAPTPPPILTPTTLVPAPRAATPAVRSHPALIAAAAIAVVAVLLVLGVLILRHSSEPTTVTVGTPSVAVLPFLDLTAEQRDGPFCDGLSEELSSWVAQIPTVRVVARTSAFSFRGAGADARKIGRELAATHLLEGSVRRSGDQIRVTAVLIDARDGYRIWTASLDRPFTDVIRIQEEIARSVAAALEIRLSDEAARRLRARKPSNARAYELYLLARNYQSERTAMSNTRALELYQQSIAADPSFAPAYAGLAYATLNQRYFGDRSMTDTATRAEPLLAKALKLNDSLPETYTVRGALRADQSRLQEALSDLRRAIALNSSDTAAFLELGRVYRRLGQPSDALASFTQAASLDPLDYMVRTELCIELQDVGRFDEAVNACSRARALEGKGAWGATVTAWLALAQGKVDEALIWTDRALAVSPENFDLYESRADYLLLLDLPSAAHATYERARRASSDDPDKLDANLAKVVFIEHGASGLREFLAKTNIERSSRADILTAAAGLRMLLGDLQPARDLLDRALAAPDFDTTPTFDAWTIRWGVSRDVLIAWVQSRTGAEAAAQSRRRSLAALLDRLERNGQVGYGLHVVRAELLALEGDADGAMRSLQRAADLGWRGVVWAQREPQLAALWPRADFRALVERVTRMNEIMRANVTPTHQ